MSNPFNKFEFVKFIHTYCSIDETDFYKYVPYNMTALEKICWTGHIEIMSIKGRIYVPAEHYAHFKCFLMACKNDLLYVEYTRYSKLLQVTLKSNQKIDIRISKLKRILSDYVYEHVMDHGLAQSCVKDHMLFMKNETIPIVIFKNMVINTRDVSTLQPLIYQLGTIQDLEINEHVHVVDRADVNKDATKLYYSYALRVNAEKSFFKPSQKTIIRSEGVKPVEIMVCDENHTDALILNFESKLFMDNPHLLQNIEKKYEFDASRSLVYFNALTHTKCNQCSTIIKKYVLSKSSVRAHHKRCRHVVFYCMIEHPFFEEAERRRNKREIGSEGEPMDIEISEADSTMNAWLKTRLQPYNKEVILDHKLSKRDCVKRIHGHLGFKKRKSVRLKIKNVKKKPIVI